MKTPNLVFGQSHFSCLMKSSERSCPPVVGMAKGTGDLAQYEAADEDQHRYIGQHDAEKRGETATRPRPRGGPYEQHQQ